MPPFARYCSLISLAFILASCVSTDEVIPNKQEIRRPFPAPDKTQPIANEREGMTEMQADSYKGTTVAPPPEASIASGNDDGVKVVINFVDKSSNVDKASKLLLRRHAAILKSDQNLVVTLLGYVDFSGSHSYNLALAEDRMNSVREILSALGVGIGQIRWRSEGQRGSVPFCNTKSCRQFRQRVELVYAEKMSLIRSNSRADKE